MKNLILCLLLSWAFTSCAQSSVTFATSGYTSFTTYSQRFHDVFASAYNSASIASSKEVTAGIVSERKYFLKELNSLAAIAVIPLQHAGLGLQLNWFGSASYNESSIRIVYGRMLSERINIGVQCGYGMMRIPGYGNGNSIQYGVGSTVRVTEKLLFGLQIQNPVTTRFGADKDELLPSLYAMGLGYELSDQVFAGISIIKESGQPVNINLGLHYAFHPQFFARAGVATNSGTPFGGFGMKWKNWRLDIAATANSQLGITPLLMIVFNKNKTASNPDEK